MDFHEYANLFPMLDDTELGELADDIRNNGLHDEIVLYDGKILDGRNRYLACREANVQPRYEQYNGNDPLGFVVSKNLHRRHLTSSQRAVIALDALPALEEKARERQVEKLKQGNELPVVEKIPEREQGRARERAAEMFGTNPRYVSDAKKIAEEAPELLPEIRAGRLNLPEAKREIRKARQVERRDEIKEVSIEQAHLGRYAVICADPPWSYRNSGFDQSAAQQYPTMPTDEICDMPIHEHVMDDAVLFLWATSPLLPDAIRVMSAWGFEYKASMVWYKNRAPGQGWWVQTYHELVLVGARGSLHPEVKPKSVFEYPVQAHSQKPDEFYEIVEGMYPGLTYLELFARRQRPGWKVYGNEV